MLTPLQIRGTLREWVGKHLSHDPSDIMIDEFGFVNSRLDSVIDLSFRADLALANGRLVGFEIKSGSDSLKRWPAQHEGYSRVFDETWLCTHGRHLEKALEITPKNVGILLVDDLSGVAMLRAAKSNNSTNGYDVSGLLWREELDVLCAMHGIESKKRETKASVRAKVSSHIAVDQIKGYVLACLKARQTT